MNKRNRLRNHYFRLKYKYGSLLPMVLGIVFFFFVFFYGMLIFMYVEGWTVWESFYQVIITLSTVGFQEIHQISEQGRLMTAVLILLGVGSFAYIVGSFTQFLVEGKAQDVWGRRRMQKMINKLKDHYIICGYGRIGRVVAQEILGEGLPVVVVESDPGLIAQLEREGVPCILGDATEDQVLCNAGLIRAKALIACLNQVAENVYITLTARQMNPKILIVARADREDSIQKLTRAGASRAITPHMIGGRRMAQIILRPTVTDFLELAIEGRTLQMEEIRVSPGSELAGKNLVDSEIRARFNVIVIAIEKHSGQTIFNPSAQEVIHAGDNLVMVGMKENFSKLQKIMEQESA